MAPARGRGSARKLPNKKNLHFFVSSIIITQISRLSLFRFLILLLLLLLMFQQVGLGRMDAAHDAMKLLGFPRDLVRKTVHNLLEAYGGDEGWPFIEDACYKVLIDAILEQQEQGDTEKPKKEENLLEQAEENGMNHSPEEHSPIASPSQPSMQIVACTTNSDTPEEERKIAAKVIKVEEECRTPVQSIQVEEECRTPVQSIKVESSQRHGSLAHSTSRSVLPSCLTDSFQDKKLALEIQSKVPQARLPRQRRKPCYGWISSDEEEDVST